jgi:hypothetical protein
MIADGMKATDSLADRIKDKMLPIHRGVMRIGKDQLVVFGNDGYSDPRTQNCADMMFHWLSRKDWNPSPISVCQSNYTWEITCTLPDGKANEKNRLLAGWRLSQTWAMIRGFKINVRGFSDYQGVLGNFELHALGGGFTDDTLTKSFGKSSLVIGNRLQQAMLLERAVKSKGEECFVLLADVPYKAKLAGSAGYNGDHDLLCAIMLEAVGDPADEELVPDEATGYFPAGRIVFVKPSGDVHEVTGKRIMVLVDPPKTPHMENSE